MIWTRPWALAFLAGAAVVAALEAALFRWKARSAARLGDPALLAALTDRAAPRRQRGKAVLFVAGLTLAVLSLPGPRWGRSYQDVRRKGVDVVITVDVSASMLAEDVSPNRLVQAKRELGRIIEGLQGDRVAVVAFAGTAFLQCPLTLDHAAARSLLDMVDTDLIPVPGTNLAAALETSLNAFPAGAAKHKAVVLLTDGEDHSGKFDAAVDRAAKEGARLFAIGFGNPAGEVIPVRDAAGNITDYRKDKSGKTVVSKLDEPALEKAAKATGGAYHRAAPDESEVDRVLADIQGMEKKTLESRVQDRTQDRYRFPLGLALMLLLAEFLLAEARPKKTAALLLILMSLVAPDLRAQGRAPSSVSRRTIDLWRRRSQANPSDQEARLQLGQALYRSGDPSGAAEAFGHAQELALLPDIKASAAYNAGNALFRAGKTEQALEKYKEAMRLAPGDADIKHNFEFVRKMMKKGGKGGKPQGKPKRDDEKKGGDGGGEEAPEKARLKPGDLSKEDAERILQSVERQEKDARKKVKAPADRPPSEYDW